MGGLFASPQVNPNSLSAIFPCKCPQLLDWKGEVSRASFTFLEKLQTSGLDEESTLWLAANVSNLQQRYFIRQINKYKVYNHKRIEAVMNELRLLVNSKNEYIVKAYFAFQDYENLYLVTEALDSISLDTVLKMRRRGKKEQLFSEDETRYVVMALTSIIEFVHSQEFALTELSPKNIHINKKTGEIKLIEITNPAKIDAYCSSSVVSQVCPYSAPEILFRDKVLAECDFYSLGLIMYEMMTQTIAVPLPEGQEVYKRHEILKENIEIEKSQIPQSYQPDSADFLIKLLIKNPALRLGRFGLFQVKNHAWLKELDMNDSSKKGIKLTQLELQFKTKASSKKPQELKKPLIEDFSKNYFFQQQFEQYKYQLKPQSLQVAQQIQSESLVEKTSILFNESYLKMRENLHDRH